MSPESNEPDAMAMLLKRAGVRPEPDSAVSERVRAAAYAAWQQSLAKRRRRRYAFTAFAAATTLAVIGLSFTRQPTQPAESQLATVSLVNGHAQLESRTGITSILTDHSAIGLGNTVRTLDGFVRLQRSDGVEFRLDQHSELSFQSPTALTLKRGTVYVATDGAPPGSKQDVALQSAYGLVTDIGTQFSVRISDQTMDIAVREGAVVWSTHAQQAEIDAGEQFLVTAQGTTSTRALAGDAFSWLSSASAFPDSGVTVEALLAWYAAQHGLRVRFGDGVTPALLTARLYGSPSETRALARMETLLSAAGLRIDVRWQEGELWCMTEPVP